MMQVQQGCTKKPASIAELAADWTQRMQISKPHAITPDQYITVHSKYT